MTRRVITLEVDSNACSDAVAAVGDFNGIAFRLSTPLLTGQMPGFLDAVALAAYGITVTSVQDTPAGPANPDATP